MILFWGFLKGKSHYFLYIWFANVMFGPRSVNPRKSIRSTSFPGYLQRK